MLLSSPLPFPVPPALLVLAGVIDGPIVESCEFSTSATMLFPWIAALDVGRARRKPRLSPRDIFTGIKLWEVVPSSWS